MRGTTRWLLALMVVTLAASCGGDPPSTGGPGNYVFKDPASGATITYAVQAPGTRSTVGRIERFRMDAGGPEASYVEVTIDNRQGSSEADLPDLSVVTAAGETFTYREAWLLVGDWQDLVESDDSLLYNRGVDLYNSLLDLGRALPGAVVTTVMAVDGTPDDIARVFVSDGSETAELDRG